MLTNITCICRSATNPDIILRQKPPFSHPFLQKVLSLVAFNPQSRPALDARFPDAFDPIRLKTLAFVCTMTHFALANLLKEKRQEFNADEYFLVYVDYLEMDFQAEEPEEFENHLIITLADGKINLGNAEKVIPQPNQDPQGMAVAAVLAPHGSATAAVGNIFKLRGRFQVMEFLILRHTDIHQGAAFSFCYSPRSFAAKRRS
ncbi:hypothetical protein M422DRAFT_254053 [Sphaerobolus stellatus SS14]|uniref:DUF6532 domain-containing protein n=1 Tax=Sphaerobolus stellatus (strain SS14) TaxID=990650 RepID=A0A0C9V6K1_SPHS4|nr:hypothetical protein M422DRAFT_254053 [Sphaerobolus stellatus SS14]